MIENIDEYLKQPYTRILIPYNDGTYSAEILEFSGCFADGKTADEAMVNLSKAAISWIEACIEQGLEIPEPFMNQDFGGRIALRLPRSLHRQAVRFAERDGVSLNQFLISAISAKVGAEDSFARLIDKFEKRISTTAQNIFFIQFLSYSQGFKNIPMQKIIDMPRNYFDNIYTISTEIRENA
jgi:antitoxin HicB